MSNKKSRVIFAGAALVLLSSSLAVAQDQVSTRVQQPTPDARWRPWLGCWIPIDRRSGNQDIQVCVLPTSDGAGVRMMTFASNQRILDEAVRADGSAQVAVEKDCTGTIRSTWSRNGARVFRATEMSCQGQPPQRTTGISTMSAPNEWLDLQVAVVDGRESVRARRYVRAIDAPPPAIAEEVRRLGAARLSLLKMVTVDDVVEAHEMVSSRAVEAWLAETGAQVPINKRSLLTLEKADVSRPVIDLMVALTYPKHFEVRRSSGSSSSFGSLSGFDDFGFWSDPLGLAYDPYAFYYSPFGPYSGSLNQYSLPYAGYVAIPEANAEPPASGRGRVVNGSGYTQVEPRQPPPGARRSSSDSGDDTTGSSGPSSSSSGDGGGGSASPGGYSSGGSGGGQTAVPR